MTRIKSVILNKTQRHPKLVSGSPSVLTSSSSVPNRKNCIFVSSLDDFFALDILAKTSKVFMIGGAQLANYFLENNLILEFILTKFKRSYIGDAFLNIKTFDHWKGKVINKMSDYDVYKLTTK